MASKDLIGLGLAFMGIAGGVILTCISTRARDLFFLAMIWLAPMTEHYDINFVSRDFYRGTARGFEFSLVDILSISLLLSALLIPRRGTSRGYWPASLGLMILFFLYACFNVGIADPKLFGLFELFKMVRGMTIFLAVAFYLRSERELRMLILGLGLVVCYEGTLALRQRYFWGLHRVPGTLDDSNSLSAFLCTTAPFFVAAITSRLPRLLKALSALAIAVACVGVVLTISRAGVIIIALVLLGTAIGTVSVRFTPRKVLITLLIVIAATGVTLKSWKTLQTRFDSSSFKDEYTNKKTLGRGYYIRVAAAIAEDRWFGVGLNNWSYWVSQKYGPKLGYRFVPYRGTDREPSLDVPPGSNVDEAQAAPAHSLAALTAGELGLPGLVLFSVLWLRWFQMGASFLWPRIPDPMRRMGIGIFFGLCGIFLQSLTEWVFRHSPIYYTVHILLGALAALYYVKRQEKRAAKAPKLECEESLSPHYSTIPEEPAPVANMGFRPCSV
ncbi:MAG: hypothetical protein QOJ40_242 [Verrucomicrobiota bacterium]